MTFLCLIIILSLILLSALSFRKVRQSPHELQFIYSWGSFFGSFVWEDLLVYSLYFALAFSLGLLFLDIRVTFLMIGVFWAVRSAGEALYFFLQQFHVPQHHPHNLQQHFVRLHFFFGKLDDQKAYILMQVLQQSICMLAITTLFLLAKYWDALPKGF